MRFARGRSPGLLPKRGAVMLLLALAASACGGPQPAVPSATPSMAVKTPIESPIAPSEAHGPTGPGNPLTTVTQLLTPRVDSTATAEPFPPAGCGVQEITRLIDTLLDGMNRGDRAEIGQAFALDGFEEFYVGGSKGGRPYVELQTADGAELLAYVARRQARHEVRKQVEPARVFPDANRTNSVAIAFLVSRKADDLAYLEAGGKGAVYCGGPRITRWIWDGNRLP